MQLLAWSLEAWPVRMRRSDGKYGPSLILSSSAGAPWGGGTKVQILQVAVGDSKHSNIFPSWDF
jgi:hypothetical protein